MALKSVGKIHFTKNCSDRPQVIPVHYTGLTLNTTAIFSWNRNLIRRILFYRNVGYHNSIIIINGPHPRRYHECNRRSVYSRLDINSRNKLDRGGERELPIFLSSRILLTLLSIFRTLILLFLL